MKISKDLADAVMMVSCIILVLAGTTDFDDATVKTALMSVLGVLTVGMGVARFSASKKDNQHQMH